MKILAFGIFTVILLGSCASDQSRPSDKGLDTANAFLNAFYSFDQDSLNQILKHADESAKSILYYQGWAKGGNYKVHDRHECFTSGDSLVTCPVTVEDDLIKALQLELHVTDTFHLTIADGVILSIETSSNDPPLFYEARKWVRENREELTAVPCSDSANTPGACCQAVVQGFREFMATR